MTQHFDDLDNLSDMIYMLTDFENSEATLGT